MSDNETPFTGAKIALIHDDALVTYLRDQTPDIPYPGKWDLPGGGREGSESPEACALRETFEEFRLTITPDRIIWKRRYPSITTPGSFGYFLVAPITKDEISSIRFGDEGQYWRMMGCRAFLAHRNAVDYLQDRLSDYIIV